MLNVHRLTIGTALLITLGLTVTPIKALSPIHRQYIAENLQAQDSQIPNAVKQQYREDAAQLTLRFLIEQGSPSHNSVQLPKDLVQKYYNALIQVYQATDLPDRNLVVDTYNIHTFPRYSTRSLLVRVDPTQAWTQAWRNGKRLTGNAEIDALMKRFNLDLERYISSSDIAVVQASRPLNTLALAKLFNDIKGVRSEFDGAGGDGSDIQAEFKDNYLQLNYSTGSGDCPAGCSERATWTFHVYPDGKVQFAGRTGDAPPPPRKLSTSGIEGRSTSSTMPGNIPRNPDGTQPQIKPFISPVLIPITVLDRAGRKVTTIQPDKEGYFRLTLKPGTYTLVPEFQESMEFNLSNRNELHTVTVTQGQFTTTNITYTVLAP